MLTGLEVFGSPSSRGSSDLNVPLGNGGRRDGGGESESEESEGGKHVFGGREGWWKGLVGE